MPRKTDAFEFTLSLAGAFMPVSAPAAASTTPYLRAELPEGLALALGSRPAHPDNAVCSAAKYHSQPPS